MYHSSALAGIGLLLVTGCALFGQVNLYVPNSNNSVPGPDLSEFTINTTTGALTPVVGQSLTVTDDNPTEVAMTPNSKYLYVVTGNGLLDAYSVSPTGFLTVIKSSPGYAVPGSLFVAANNNFVYVSSGSGLVYVFSINQTTGALTPVTCGTCTVPGGGAAGLQDIILDPTNNFLYAALYNTHQIAVGTIVQSGASAGTLSFTTAFTGTSNFTPQNLVLTPNGANLYATNLFGPSLAGPNVVTAFTVSGATVSGGTTYATGTTPNGVTTDPSGAFLYVANTGSNNVSVYTIGAGGALTPVAGSPFAAGAGTTGVSVDPTGHFLYASNTNAGNVTSYAISGTGLTLVNTVTTGTAPLFLLAHLAPGSTVPASSNWSLAALGILLAGMAGLLYRKAYR